MSIHEFHARLTSDKTAAPIFGSLRKMMSLSDLKPARFQAPGDPTTDSAGWTIWQESGSPSAATA